ncbi:leucine-rich repeat domain, L domain-like protein [Artemisia annua]|uniref:Leucine-rich repeat domain, L domain-like protein n=1 Tax=Artemisia annua TaxID=35608 RepID=A0A2U1NM62_ARTAN|nr:leucine-rich repeat domain, L domain-like protein [Artemisia annua]
MDLHYKKTQSCISTTTHLLPDDVLYLIFEKLDSKLDQDSFGLTCHAFLNIQNSSRKCLKLGCSVLPECCCLDVFHPRANVKRLLNGFMQLESLSSGNCPLVSDSCLTPLLKYGLASIASGCHLLSIISLSKCSITNSGLKILTQSCKSLRGVNLSCCKNITDNGIRSLNQNCRQLISLNISGCDRVNGEGFKDFSETLACLEANNCVFDSLGDILSGGGLEYLNLNGVHKCIGENGLADIGLGFASYLIILDLGWCTFVDNDTIIKISKGCPLLKEWNLSYCANIGTSGWEAIGLYCKNLKILHVNYCGKLCDRGLLALGNGCKRLSVIYMCRYLKIAEVGLHVFKIKREDVEIRYEQIWDIRPSWAFTSFNYKYLKRN